MSKRLINRVLVDSDEMVGEILHSAAKDGTVAIVEQRGDVRWYHAREFSRDGRELVESGGYSTVEKHHYMGQRYKDPALWGPYYSEVFA